MVKNILVAIDGSPHARKAIDFATDLATCCSAEIYLLHVVENIRIPEEVREFIKNERSGEPPRNVYLQIAGEKIIQAAEKEVRDQGGSQVQPFVVQGDPAEKIIKFAREHDIDLIVMGRRGLGLAKELLLGSVSRKVCNLADCNCVTVK
jgi:nucleotide-binding universal stress UspA family protein